MTLELTKLDTFSATEVDDAVIWNAIHAEECYVLQAHYQTDFEQITPKFLEQKLDELRDKDDEKDDELRKKGINPNYLTKGTWEICLVKVGYTYREQINEGME